MKRNKWVATAGFFLLSFTLLLTLIDRFSFDRKFYAKEYAANDTTLATGLDEEGLNTATDVLLSYLQDDRDSLDLELQVNGIVREVFDEREKSHMVDVKNLYQNALLFRNIAAGIGVFLLCIGIFGMHERKTVGLHRSFRYGVLLLFGVVSAILIYALLDFNTFWINFHHLFFDNDLWLLDPNTEILINMVPEPFFYHLVLRIVVWFLAIIAVADGAFIFLERKIEL